MKGGLPNFAMKCMAISDKAVVAMNEDIELLALLEVDTLLDKDEMES